MKILRYTSLPVLLDMLIHKHLVLLDPSSWEDRNDSFYVERYRELKHMKTVLALCFTTKPETSHHWKVFAGDSGGVCIHFDKEKPYACLRHDTGIKSGMVVYKLMRELRKKRPSLDDLPFLKRKQYEDEAEFRIVYENMSERHKTKAFALDLSSIVGVTLNPWIPQPVYDTVKAHIRGIPGCAKIKFKKTGLIEYEPWKDIAIGTTR